MYELPQRPPIDTTHLSLVLTVPTARPQTAAALGEWVGYLNGSELGYEILLVSEQPGQSVEGVAGPFSRVRALPSPERGGFGAALALGLAQASHPLVFYGQCDPCYKPADVKQLLKLIDKVDLVVGQRTFPAGHRLGVRQRIYRWFVRLFFGVRLRDLECIFVLARRSIFARIPIQSHGTFAHAEVLAKANFLGCYFSDVPVSYRPDAGTAPFSAGAEHWLADARRIISNPDFGPARLDETQPGEPGASATGVQPSAPGS